jgi:hypothetical protein
MDFIQIRAPKGDDPGKVLEGHYNLIGDTVILVDRSGKAVANDGEKFSRWLSADEKPKQVGCAASAAAIQCDADGPRL